MNHITPQSSIRPLPQISYGNRISITIALSKPKLPKIRYDLNIKIDGAGDEELPKTDVKLIYPEDLAEPVTPLIKIDKKIRDLGLEPIISPGKRYHIKNKSLFPLMKEKRFFFSHFLRAR